MHDEVGIAGLIGFAVGIGIGILFGAFLGVSITKKEAINSGHAHYNQISGELEWGPPAAEK